MITKDLNARAGKAASWAVLQGAGKHGIDLLVFLVLAKLLVPQDFGLVAMAGAFIVVAGVLVEMGLTDALIQRQALTPSHQNAAFWAATGVGLALAALTAGLAPWAAARFGHAELAPVLQALAPLFLLNALSVVPQALLQRDLRFGPLAFRTLAGAVAGGVVGVAAAWGGLGAWALVAQQLVSATVGLVLLLPHTAWRPQRQFDTVAAGELLRFSRHVMGARLLNVAASKADALLVGLFLGPLALGFYSVACRILLAVEQLFCQGVDAVALSAFSRAAHDTRQLRALYERATQLAALTAVPVFGGLAWMAHDVLGLIIGTKWAASAPLLQILLGAGLVQALTHFNHAVFKAGGRPELSLRLAAWSTGLNVATLTVAVQFGIEAVAWSYLARTALIAPWGVVLACRMTGMPLPRYLARLLSPAALFLMALAIVVLLQRYALHDAGPAWRVAMSAAVGLACYVLLCRCCHLPLPGLGMGREAAPRALAAAVPSSFPSAKP